MGLAHQSIRRSRSDGSHFPPRGEIRLGVVVPACLCDGRGLEHRDDDVGEFGGVRDWCGWGKAFVKEDGFYSGR